MPTTAAYGSWKSPIEAREIAEGTLTLREPRMDGERVYWIEHRPMEGGRYAVQRREPDGSIREAIPAEYNARTRVHEYGGGSYLPCGDDVVFTHFADQRLYRADAAGRAQLVAPEDGLRYADLICDPARRRLIAVREDHRGAGEPVNAIAAICPHEPGRGGVLVGGNDFYAAPRLSPDGSTLAWLTWNHPDMPWDAAELWVAPVRADGSLAEAARVAGGGGESIVQPEWSPDGQLWFVSDRTGWWNLYRRRGGQVEAMTDLAAEFARPAWVFAMSSYAFVSAGEVLCTYLRDGVSHLARLDAAGGELAEIDSPYTMVTGVCAGGGRAAFIGGRPSRPNAMVLYDPATGEMRELRRESRFEIDAGCVSEPRPVEFPTEGGLTAHGLFYEPKNAGFSAPAGEKPPLLVMVHGGPTSATATAMNLKAQFYASRGLAVLDVNYGGSTGYGRAYRERLCGQWGVVDVDDACNGAKRLAERGLVDKARMAITGGSAGGYTTLSCLAFRDTFAAGSSHFGVSDCEALAVETHKFESRYLDKLIGPYPQRRDLYVQRSPIHHVEGFRCPVIFFQGLEDRIVPPNQARRMADALRAKGIPTALLEFAGEQHGFRRAENIRRCLEAELYFLSRVFGFPPADALEPVPIDGL